MNAKPAPTDADIIREIRDRYVARSVEWIAKYGKLDGFDDWFTQQVLTAAKQFNGKEKA